MSTEQSPTLLEVVALMMQYSWCPSNQTAKKQNNTKQSKTKEKKKKEKAQKNSFPTFLLLAAAR
jgi:hypothetical protein